MINQIINNPLSLIPLLITLVVALTFHEFAHAWTANRFGDDTPRANGRLTLNPVSHLDLVGSLVFLLTGFGWAKPVPVNLFALERRNPFAPVWVALAGPMSNLTLAVIAAIPLQLSSFGFLSPALQNFLILFIQLNLILMVFNLIPISPLDGEKVLTYLLPIQSGLRNVMDQIRPYGPMILIFLIFAGPFVGFDLLSTLVIRPVSWMCGLLSGAGC